MSYVTQPKGLLLFRVVLYLASSSRGVSVHLVVSVVVTALESAPTVTAESSDSSRTHRSHIFKPTPDKRIEVGIRWEVDANEMKSHCRLTKKKTNKKRKNLC